MFRIIAALIGVVGTLPAFAAESCGSDLRGAQTLRSVHYTIAYRTQPAKIIVGKHFSIDIVACANGVSPSPSAVAVDAFMPDHGHGMNYKATVRATGNAHFRADGLMFHMPGRWDLMVEVQGADGSERLTRSIVIE